MNDWKRYNRKGFTEAIHWTPSLIMDGISVNQEDKDAGSPKWGDMIFRNPANHNDMWLVAKAFFEKNYNTEPNND